MPVGKQIGKFSLKTTSITYSPTGGDSEVIDMNMDGTIDGADGTATVLGTLTGSPSADAKSGTYSWVGREFAANGDTRLATGAGFFNASGTGKWALRGYIAFADGTGGAVEGELELASRTLSGTLCEWT